MKIHHLLIPTDLSGASRRLIGWTRMLAKEHDAKVSLLHIVPDLKLPGWSQNHEVPAEVQRDIDDATPLLKKLATEFGDDLRLEMHVLPAESRAPAIADYARDHGADAILIALHEKNDMQRFVLGSCGEKIVRLSPVPVLTVPP